MKPGWISEPVGWVKMHRSIDISDISDDPIAEFVLLKLVRWAHRKPRKTMLCGKATTLSRGQCIVTVAFLEEKTWFSRNQINYALERLEKEKRIQKRKTNQGTVVTILNYNKYQDVNDHHSETDSETNSETNQKRTRNEPETDSVIHNVVSSDTQCIQGINARARIVDEEVKNIRSKETIPTTIPDTLSVTMASPPDEGVSEIIEPEVIEPILLKKKAATKKPKKAPPSVESYDPTLVALAQDWLNWAKESAPHIASRGAWTVERFLDEMRKTMKATNMTIEGFRMVFDFVKRDKFWRRNMITPVGIHHVAPGKDQSKLDRVVLQMKPNRDWDNETMQRNLEQLRTEGPHEWSAPF